MPKIYADVRPPCDECLRLMVPQGIWHDVPKDERAEMRAEGYVCASSGGVCTACYQRRAKAKARVMAYA